MQSLPVRAGREHLHTTMYPPVQRGEIQRVGFLQASNWIELSVARSMTLPKSGRASNYGIVAPAFVPPSVDIRVSESLHEYRVTLKVAGIVKTASVQRSRGQHAISFCIELRLN